MAGYYDPNKDYSIAIEQAKKAGQDTTQLEQERANKIADKYGGKEPTMYGSNQTYSSLSANSGDYLTNKANQGIISNALAVGQSEDSLAAYYAGKAGDWDKAASYINNMAEWNEDYQAYEMGNANDYWKNLSNMLGYNAEDYYNQRYDEAFGKGSAAAFDASGGAIKTYAELVERAGGVDKAEQALAGYYAGLNNSNSVPGLSLSAGQVGIGGMDDMTKYLEELYAKNLEAELSALKSAYDSNVAELESQNDAIAEQYRAARNQAAAQNALQTQSMNERALATGLNTGTSGQLALAQNMAYQGNLGNLWAQEAQDKAESDRLLAELTRDYNAGVNQTTANINAQRAEAMYNELIRQQNARAAAEEALREQERYDREWKYMLEQDALDRQLAYAQMAARNNGGGGGTPGTEMTLTTAKAMADAGQFTDDVIATLLNAGYNDAYLQTEYGYTPPAPVVPQETGNQGIPEDQIKILQRDINKYLPEGQKIAVDGIWGPATQAAAGGFSAKDYAREYFRQNSWSGRSDR